MQKSYPLILASGSPRRQELLARLDQPFTVCVADCDETLPEGIAPDQAVRILAQRKAEAGAALQIAPCRVLGADTVVAFEGKILGKPQDAEAAVAMLTALQDHWNTVYTGVCLWTPDGVETIVDETRVHMMPISEAAIRAYAQSGDPLDKAGSYGIQGWAGAYIDRIEGCYYNAMGLPLARVRALLQAEGGI